MKPGSTRRPARSITCVRGPWSARASAEDPTWTMRSPRTATACASGNTGSTVHTRPPWMTRSAGSAVLARAAPRIAAGAVEVRDDERDDEHEEEPSGVLAHLIGARRGDEPRDRERGDGADRELPIVDEKPVGVVPDPAEHARHCAPPPVRPPAAARAASGRQASSRRV